MNYTNREVVRRLKQYDMFLNSLNLATGEVQKERICDQLDKIEKQILLETNNEYESEYMLLFNRETEFFDEEKDRLRSIITLINERKKYLEERKYNHKNITGSLVELTTFLGEDKLNLFKRNLEIIEKYEENKNRQENLIKEMKSLDVKLSEASRIVKANTRLNEILENKMREIVSRALDKLNLYSLISKKDEIIKKFEVQEYAFKLANDNLKMAKDLKIEKDLVECEDMLSQVSGEYSKYEEMVNILKIIELYDDTVVGYEELLLKRENMNDIIRSISDSELYKEIAVELNKQYNTIKLEKKDIDNYEFLKKERETKNKALYDIEEENNSKEFKIVIDELLRNENRVREERIRKAKNDEYQERQRKLLEEQKIEASRIRRQKLVEEARLKEQQERVEKVKQLQEKTVINSKKASSLPEVEVIKKKDDVEDTREKINNPLKNKTLDEVLSFSDDFDTDELFENTKIVPNKIKKEESILSKEEDKKIDEIVEDKKIEEDNTIFDNIELPVWGAPTIEEETIDLFKEDTVVEDIKIEEPAMVEEDPIEEKKIEEVKEEVVTKKEDKQEVVEEEKKQPSIYDILENNNNIIWKTTDTKVKRDSIPVINNNNLKPEVLDSKKVNDVNFPKLESGKDGEFLWK